VHEVEVWQPIVSGSARSLDFMARHGIKGVVSATAEEFVGRWFRDYQEAAGRHGRTLQLGEDLILGFRMSIDETVERAIQKARPYFEEHAKFMAPLGMLRYSEEHVKAVAARQAQSATAATLENGVRNRSWLCGPPSDIVAYLKEVEARYPGLDHVMIAWALSTPRDLMIEQLTRFAREVMPAFAG
jgi:alkanesulfonate monooxygenase SsuD/methylene tetrahydromethanopterin reductase-like flavin-dependent oxidoreductase (luciferase family)